MSLREGLKELVTQVDYMRAEDIRSWVRDHGQALLEALVDSERMNELELSQRADVYWHENGDQELAGYEWGCGGQYSTARDALDAAIAARSKTVDGGGV